MIQLIQAATQSQTNEHRKQAQRQIIEHRDSNPEQFFQQITQVFKSQSNQTHIRQTSGTLIMVSLLAKNKNGVYFWDTISGDMKNYVKNSNLELLIDNLRTIRRTAANIVSAICFIELPRKQWDGIVEKICLNVSHESEVVKQASILTLGFICSRMRQRQDFQFPQQTQNSILSGIILGLQQQQQLLVQTSLKALRDSIPSLQETLKTEQVRQFVLGQLVGIINHQKYKMEGLQILGQFVKTCYVYLAPYFDGIVQLLDPILANTGNEQACIAAMQVYENVADTYKQKLDDGEKNLINYIVGNYGIKIVTALLKNLTIMSDQDEADDNNISDSANNALETIFTNGSMEYKNLVMEFVKATIQNKDWKSRQASIKGFALLLHGLPDSQHQLLLSSSINQLINLLNDTKKQVQFSTMQSLTLITQLCGKYFLQSQYLIQYLKLILNKIQVSQKFLKAGCKIIDNLCEAQKDYKLSKFSLIADDLIGIFMKFMLDGTTSLACVNWTTITIMNIIQVTNSQQTLLKYLGFVLENFDNIGTIKDRERRDSITSAFFTFMQFSLHAFSKTKTKIIEQNVVEVIYTKVTNTFKSIGDVTADGMFVISALVQYFNGNTAVVNDFWGYITHALNKCEDHMIFKATVCCIASFLTVYGDVLTDKLPTFVPPIIELLENPNFAKQYKIQCLVLMGEVFLSCGVSATPYLQKFLQVLLLCCAAAIQLTQTQFQYSQQLKDNILQSLMCIIHGLSQATPSLSNYIPNFVQFINISCQKKSRPTVAYLKRSILLMVDFYKFYPNVVRSLKQEGFMNECLNTLGGYNKSGEFTSTIKYAKESFR